MEESQFDVIVLGTGLVNSISAAALAKNGFKVAHIDSNPYYGGDEATLSLEELVQWADNVRSAGTSSRFQRLTRSSEVPLQSRQYSICLQPSVIPSIGPLISSLVSSGVAKYSGFKLLESVGIYDPSGHVKHVPGSKEDIFKSKEISLIEKRRLMRFLTFAAADFEDKKELAGMEDSPFIEFLPKVFSLSAETASIICYSLAFCMSPSEPTLSTLRRLRNYLRSGGRYGPSPFLVGHYGGIGDIAQGFCRAAAVSGGVYILSRAIKGIKRLDSANTPSETDAEPSSSTDSFDYAIDLDDFPDTLTCKMIISSPTYAPSEVRPDVYRVPSSSVIEPNVTALARCIFIIDQPLILRPASTADSDSATPDVESQEEGQTTPQAAKQPEIDSAVVVFPPSSVAGGSSTHPATVLVNGEGSLSTPKGKWLVYITLPLDKVPEESITPESLLQPYLDALLELADGSSGSPPTPLFKLFYLETPDVYQPSQPDNAPLDNTLSASSTYLVPATLPIASLPDLPDQATTIAEATFRAATDILRLLKPANTDVEQEESLPFWPPLPRDEEEDDNEW